MTPKLKPFDPDQLLQELAQKGPGPFLRRRVRGDWLGLYRRFLASQNFQQWFQRRRTSAVRAQQEAWRRARSTTQIHTFLPNMNELELVDAFAIVENQLTAEMAAEEESNSVAITLAEGASWKRPEPARPSIKAKLRRDLWAIYECLPRDVQQTLSFSPHRAALLQGFSKVRMTPGHVTRTSFEGKGNTILSRNNSIEAHHLHQMQQRNLPSDTAPDDE